VKLQYYTTDDGAVRCIRGIDRIDAKSGVTEVFYGYDSSNNGEFTALCYDAKGNLKHRFTGGVAADYINWLNNHEYGMFPLKG
jgi:hypothetical protein